MTIALGSCSKTAPNFENILFGDQDFRLFTSDSIGSSRNPEFILVSKKPKVVEVFNLYKSGSILADWKIVRDTLILNHLTGHEFIHRFSPAADTVVVLEQHNMPLWNPPLKWLIKKNSIVGLNKYVLHPEIYEGVEGILLSEYSEYIRIENAKLRIKLPGFSDTTNTTVCKGG